MDKLDANFSIDLVLMHNDLELKWGSELKCASKKGYPEVFDKMVFWVLCANRIPIAHTGSLVSNGRRYALVGNTYVRKEWRSKGLHTHLLNERNNAHWLKGIPKITVLNPIEGVTNEQLVSVVSKLGYTKVNSYADVMDIMTGNEYKEIYRPPLEIWRLE
tara:strand:- start:33666 stop:34145 length:480 start_codon:yes stop_codon:yes gene_type:complete